MTIPDVIVVGGGVIGLTAAWRLAKTGLQVRLLEREIPGREASWAGAGIIPPGVLHPPKPELGLLYRRSCELWPEWSQQLRDQTGIDNGYRRCGGIELVDSLAERESALNDWLRIDEEAFPVDEEALSQQEPALQRRTSVAYVLPRLAQVRNPWHLQALQAACVQAGVDIVHYSSVERLQCSGERVIGCITPRGIERGGTCLVAGGAWSRGLLESAGVDCQLEPIRGQMVLLRGRPGLLRHVIEAGSRYIVPRNDGRILIGSTEERVGFDKSTTSEGIAGLLKFGLELVPALASLPVEKVWSGLRPWLAEGPWIGRPAGWTNLLVATGHFRSGLTLSPATALKVVELVTGDKPEGSAMSGL